MNHPIALALAAGFAVALLPSPAASQQSSFPSGVELVAVDVTVVDRRGNPVTDLAAEDFSVTVDGRARRIVAARLVRHETAAHPAGPAAASSAGSSPAAPTAPLPPRVLVLVPDTSSLSTSGARAVAKAASRFLDLLSPRDLVALVPVPTGPAVDFTTDRTRLRDALGKLMGGRTRVSTFGHVTLGEAFSRWAPTAASRRLWDDAVRRECSLCRTPQECSACQRMLEVDARTVYETARGETRLTTTALLRILDGLAGIEGPKTLVFFSQGLVTGASGGDLGGSHGLAVVGEAAAAARTSVYTVHVDRTFLDSMEASQGGIAASAVEDAWLARDGLEAIAGFTGGSFIRAVAGAEFALERVAVETSATWLLSFEPEDRDRDGRLHEIRVRLARPGAQVRARPQFVVPKARAKPLDVAATGGYPTPSEAVAHALAEAPASTGAPPSITTCVLGGAGSLVEVVVVAELPADTAAAAVRLLDSGGLVVSPGTLDLRAEPMAAPSGLEYGTASVSVAPGTYRWRLASMDDAGRLSVFEGTIDARLHRQGSLELSDLLLAEPGARASGGSAITVRQVRGRVLRAYLEVRGATVPGSVAVQLELIDASGETRMVANAPVSPDTRGMLSADTSVEMAALPAGRYVVRAVVLRDGEEAGRVEREVERPSPR